MSLRNSYLMVAAGIALGALFGSGAANAADLPERTYTRPLPAAPAAYNWNGCYLGGYAGYANQSREINAWEPASTGGAIPAGTYYNPLGLLPADQYNIGEFNYDMRPSAIGGGTLGCNWQGSWPVVIGIEAEGGYMKIAGSTVPIYSVRDGTNDTIASTRIGDWHASVSGRFGYAWDRVLLYLKAGVGFSPIHASVTDTCTAAPCSAGLLTATGSSNQPFWVAGGGVEYAFSDSWSIKVEYLTLGMYKKFEVCGPGGAAAAGSTFCSMHNIEGARAYKLGVNYHFDMPGVARN